MKKTIIHFTAICLTILGMGFTQADDRDPVATVGIAKLIVDDLAETQKFYEDLFGMKEVTRYDYDLDTYEETIMAFESGARLALFAPNDNVEIPLAKSQYPVVLIYTPEFAKVVERIQSSDISHSILQTGEGGPKIVIAQDPSGNAVEIYGRDGPYAIGGSKLIVSDRSKAEAFYKKIFSARSGQVYQSANVYDEVIMDFVEGGAWLALFQPLVEKSLPKSRFPSTAFYTTDFENVLKRLDEEGYGYWQVDTQSSGLEIVIAQDPAGNAIEIIAR